MPPSVFHRQKAGGQLSETAKCTLFLLPSYFPSQTLPSEMKSLCGRVAVDLVVLQVLTVAFFVTEGETEWTLLQSDVHVDGHVGIQMFSEADVTGGRYKQLYLM